LVLACLACFLNFTLQQVKASIIMANVVIVGAQWGDEGKAKITDMLAQQADVVIRSQGGCNAGHTVKVMGQTFKFHLLPSGLLYGGKCCIIGPGTVIYPTVLLQEIADLKAKGFDVSQLAVSDRAHITLPFHLTQDVQLETARSNTADGLKIGTTGRGIGPTYMDKVSRLGLRMHELYEPGLENRLAALLAVKQLPATDLPALLAQVTEWADGLKPFVTDTTVLAHQCIQQGKRLLFEGAQGALLDIDHGTYPFVTSSNATAGGASTGSGVGPAQLHCVVGVFKAYITRVGGGPFPSELLDATGDHLVDKGHEFGTTTGRRRRCGWYDAVLARYSAMVNGLDALAITKLDVMDELAEVAIVTGYRLPDGQIIEHFPASAQVLASCTPVLERMPGWQTSTRGVTEWYQLPKAAQTYLRRLESLTGAPIAMVSTGPDREETVITHDVFAFKRGVTSALTS
jgi:adenylosuccinate synthase